jgi:hypothetical protein
MSDSQCRRQHPRLKVRLPVEFAVVVPEETFAPQVFEAVVCDLSEGGAMVAVNLSDSVYRRMLQATRYVRLTFAGDHPGLPRLIGRAVYMQPISKGAATEYRIGLCFEDLPAESRGMLRTYLAERSTTPDAGHPAGGDAP